MFRTNNKSFRFSCRYCFTLSLTMHGYKPNEVKLKGQDIVKCPVFMKELSFIHYRLD
jgi:hypothetical protein